LFFISICFKWKYLVLSKRKCEIYVKKIKSQVKYMLSQEDLFAKALMVEEPWIVDKVQFDQQVLQSR